jgi:hypothetical protein
MRNKNGLAAIDAIGKLSLTSFRFKSNKPVSGWCKLFFIIVAGLFVSNNVQAQFTATWGLTGLNPLVQAMPFRARL